MGSPAPLRFVYHGVVAGSESVGVGGVPVDGGEVTVVAHRTMQTHLPDVSDARWCAGCGERHPCGVRREARAHLVGVGRLVLAGGAGRGAVG